MKVVLLVDVKGQGKKDQVIDVSDGYARNFLLPRKLAKEANAASVNDIKGRHDAEAFRKNQEFELAKQNAEEMGKITVSITAKGGISGRIFGSITTKEISEQLKKQYNLEIDKRKIIMPDDGIKSFGTYELDVKLHANVVGKLKLNVIQES